MLSRILHVLVQADTTQFLKFKRRYLPDSKKGGIILIIFLLLKFRLINYLRISRPLKLLPKVFVRQCSQENLFRKVSGNYYRSICGGASRSSQVLCSRHILLNTFTWMRRRNERYTFRGIILEFQKTFRQLPENRKVSLQNFSIKIL